MIHSGDFLGKAISKSIKTHCEAVLEKFPEKFSADFEKNKKALSEMDLPFSKVERNLIAGFIARTKKAETN